eukprot:10631107-Prorocentrum_lima.AAC.1
MAERDVAFISILFVGTPWSEKPEDTQFWDWATNSFQVDAGSWVGMPPLNLILTSTQDEELVTAMSN